MGVLTKVFSTNYESGTPGRPATPAYSYVKKTCARTQEDRPIIDTVCGFWDPQYDNEGEYLYDLFIRGQKCSSPECACIDDIVGYQYIESVRCNEETIFVPADPGESTVMPQTISTVLVGWDAGARSVEALPQRGGIRFSIPVSSVGVFVGLSRQDNSPHYRDLTHSLYFHRGKFEVYESGVPVGVSGTYTNSDTFEIRRTNGAVTYRKVSA